MTGRRAINNALFTLAIAMSVVLGGCIGGGGGGGSAPAPVPPVPQSPGQVAIPPETAVSVIFSPTLENPDPGDSGGNNPDPPPASSSESNPCEDDFNTRDTPIIDCNRARVPGLTPLYDMVSANIAQAINNGETVNPLLIIIDGDYTFIDGDGIRRINPHGDKVVKTANISTVPNLYDYVETGELKSQTVSAYRNIKDRDDIPTATIEGNQANTGFIINISQSNLFGTDASSGNSARDLITPQDVADSKSLMVAPTGNYGNTVDTVVINRGQPYALTVDPDHPMHNRAAVEAIHNRTKSILMVAGLAHGNTAGNYFPILETRENNGESKGGFHKEWRIGSSKIEESSLVIDDDSNHCGYAKNYCVLAPYTIFTELRDEIDGTYVYYRTGTSYAAPMVAGTLANLRYVWPHLTNEQLVKLSCATAVDLGAAGVDDIYGCGMFSVSQIWQPTGELVADPLTTFSLSVTSGGVSISGASIPQGINVTGYENNEFRRGYAVPVSVLSSASPLLIEPAVSWSRLSRRFLRPGRVSTHAARLFTVFQNLSVFLSGKNSAGGMGIAHSSGFSLAYERESDAFFGSAGSGSFSFGDTDKVVASFDRQFDLNGTYGIGVKAAAAYGGMNPGISLVKSARGRAETAQVELVRRKNSFETRLQMRYSSGLSGGIKVQDASYELKPEKDLGVLLSMSVFM
ncbi:MAG: S8 family serine peptidase [Thermodesulfobacteriota bacterium]